MTASIPPSPRPSRPAGPSHPLGSPFRARIRRTALLCAACLLWPAHPGAALSAEAFPAPMGPEPSPPVTEGTPGATESTRGRWQWPLGGPAQVMHRFEAPSHRYGPGHRGIDITGAGAVRAVEGGTVRFAGSVAGRPVISVLHSDGLLSTYEPVSTELSAGDRVHAGQVIGELDASAGSASHCAPQLCLHLGARLGEDYLDPLLLLGLAGPSVLLPHASAADGTAFGSARAAAPQAARALARGAQLTREDAPARRPPAGARH